jgi:hypothetical protein
MGSCYTQVVYVCKNVPPYSCKPSFSNIMSDLSVLLGLGAATIFLFLTLGLIFVALAQLIVSILVGVASYRSIFKPFYEKRMRQQ